MSAAARGVPNPHPVLPTQRLGRRWIGVTPCPHHALARGGTCHLGHHC